MPYGGVDFYIFWRADFESAFPGISPEAAGLQPLSFSGEEGPSALVFYKNEYDDGGDVSFLWDVLPNRELSLQQVERLQKGIKDLPAAYINNAA